VLNISYLGEKTDTDQLLKEFILKRKTGLYRYFAAVTVLLQESALSPAL